MSKKDSGKDGQAGHGHGHGQGQSHSHRHSHKHSHRRGHGSGHKFDISRLERLRDPERLETLNPDKIWAAISEGLEVNTLVDLGVGIGFFAIPFARKIPGGTVYGCDLNPQMLEYLTAASEQEKVDNIRPIQTAEVEVPLEDGLADLVIMVNLHHELDFRDRTLAECRRLLREGGRIAVVDWAPIETEHGPPLEVRIPPDQVRAELEAAGFRAIAEHEILPQHYCITGTR